jgi:hypothetical protein
MNLKNIVKLLNITPYPLNLTTFLKSAVVIMAVVSIIIILDYNKILALLTVLALTHMLYYKLSQDPNDFIVYALISLPWISALRAPDLWILSVSNLLVVSSTLFTLFRITETYKANSWWPSHFEFFHYSPGFISFSQLIIPRLAMILATAFGCGAELILCVPLITLDDNQPDRHDIFNGPIYLSLDQHRAVFEVT